MYQKIRVARFYRNKPGDVDCSSLPFFEGTDQELEEGLREALLDRFNHPPRGQKPPTTAEIIEEMVLR